MVKPNRDEMEQLFGEKLDSMEAVIACAEKIQAMGIPHVVVSLGGDGALLVCREGCYRAVIPRLEVVNTVGCGDSMVGRLCRCSGEKLSAGKSAEICGVCCHGQCIVSQYRGF